MRFRNCPSSPAMSRARRGWTTWRMPARMRSAARAGLNLHDADNVAGVGIPQMTALYVCSARGGEEKSRHSGDGGIMCPWRYREGVIASVGDLRRDFCRLQRSAGQWWRSAASHKQYRGMGSLRRCELASRRVMGYDKNPTQKVAAEGIEALKEACGQWTACWRN